MSIKEQTFQDYIDLTDSSSGFIKMAKLAIDRWGVMGTAARYLLMRAETNKFIKSSNSILNSDERKKLIRSFNKIQAEIQCVHSPYQFVLMAKYILDLEVEGPIIECGCYKGGGSAKLSLLAKITNRKLIICDSFAGLPSPKESEEARLEMHSGDHGIVYAGGEYSAALDEVKRNIEKTGCIDVCDFVPGFYSESLQNVTAAPACVVMDVDLISSARDCLKHLWAKTAQNGLWFTHEAHFPYYISGILDAEWWKCAFNEAPPVIFGAGSGLSECASSLAYFKKTSV